MKFQDLVKKSFVYDSLLSQDQLSEQITEAAFNTSAFLTEFGRVQTDNPTYRNAYVTHPSIEDATEDGVIPPSTVQTYSTTASSFSKVSQKIQFTSEVLDQPKFDIQGNTSMLSGAVLANKIAELAITDITGRLVPTPTTLEQVRELKSGVMNEWGADSTAIYEFIAGAVKYVPDVYDTGSKLFLNKNNFIDFASLTQDTAQGSDQVWMIQNGLLLGRYEIVICDQLPDDTMYFGNMLASMDIVSMSGNQTVDGVTIPDLLQVTTTNKYAFVAKDTQGLVAMTKGV
ncbi:hypothetical protein VIBRN418_01638 [Vibrio sp. N418]|uniref:phage major capsid protein n=1 Tax=Vibrio sp. (strain N418) TaxID=701176 RepID=UPI00021C076C|nr:phage major capsid protein [Vibrio sp. N418]EGU31484.1 hypothetical protein VIBRN418_01638 [Vibrio sp. N418]